MGGYTGTMLKIRFSDEDAYQRRHGHGTAVFLSAF
jgi:hypothetical protein